MNKASIKEKFISFLKGYRVVQTKKFLIVWNRKTGEPIRWILPSSNKPPLEPLADMNVEKRKMTFGQLVPEKEDTTVVTDPVSGMNFEVVRYTQESENNKWRLVNERN